MRNNNNSNSDSKKKTFVLVLGISLGISLISCVFNPAPNPVPRPSPSPIVLPTATSTAIPHPTVNDPTPSPVPTDSAVPIPPPVETFRGGLGSVASFYKKGAFTCAKGDGTTWFYMTGGIQTCDPRSKDRSPCDKDHFSCPAVAVNCSNVEWGDPRGEEISIITGKRVTVVKDANQYGFEMCAKPGPVSFNICPQTGFYACYPTKENCKKHVPLVPKFGNGCSGPHVYNFPKL